MPIRWAAKAAGRADGDGVRCGPDVGPRLVSDPAGEFHQEVNNTLGGDVRHVPVNAAFEALGRLGGQLVAAAGTANGHLIEVRGFHQDVRRRIAHLGGCAAHHTRDTDGTGAVRNEEVLDVERALLVVQCGDRLPCHGPADHDVAGQFVQVIAVRGLAELEHHVVGDVHGQGNGADSSKPQPGGHPRRRRLGGVDAPDGAGHEAVAAGLAVDGRVVVELHAVAAGKRRRGLDPGGRVREGGPGGVGEFTGHAADGEGIAPVRGHVDLGCLVIETQQFHGVGADFRVEPDPGQHQDAVVVLADAKLTD